MINNLHYQEDKQEISKEDLRLFEVCFNNNISGVMVGHQIVNGELDSKGKPSSVSEEIIKSLDNFSGLIISDEINMNGLKSFYYFDKKGTFLENKTLNKNLHKAKDAKKDEFYHFYKLNCTVYRAF